MCIVYDINSVQTLPLCRSPNIYLSLGHVSCYIVLFHVAAGLCSICQAAISFLHWAHKATHSIIDCNVLERCGGETDYSHHLRTSALFTSCRKRTIGSLSTEMKWGNLYNYWQVLKNRLEDSLADITDQTDRQPRGTHRERQRHIEIQTSRRLSVRRENCVVNEMKSWLLDGASVVVNSQLCAMIGI